MERNDNICRHTNRQSRTVQKLRPPYPQVSSRETRANSFESSIIFSQYKDVKYENGIIDNYSHDCDIGALLDYPQTTVD